jgi:hypothetical protein
LFQYLYVSWLIVFFFILSYKPRKTTGFFQLSDVTFCFHLDIFYHMKWFCYNTSGSWDNSLWIFQIFHFQNAGRNQKVFCRKHKYVWFLCYSWVTVNQAFSYENRRNVFKTTHDLVEHKYRTHVWTNDNDFWNVIVKQSLQ